LREAEFVAPFAPELSVPFMTTSALALALAPPGRAGGLLLSTVGKCVLMSSIASWI